MGGDAENDIHETRNASPTAGGAAALPRAKSDTTTSTIVSVDAKLASALAIGTAAGGGSVSAPPTPYGHRAAAGAHHTVSFRIDSAATGKDTDTNKNGASKDTDKNGDSGNEDCNEVDDAKKNANNSNEVGGATATATATFVKVTRAQELASALMYVRVIPQMTMKSML
jgi:hypothetical protein